MRSLAAIAVAVAVLVASPGAATSQPLAGKFVGTSAQGLAFKLTVAPDRRTLTLDVRWRCEGRHAVVRMLRVRGVAIAESGAFAWEGTSAEGGGDDDPGRRRLRIMGHDEGGAKIAGVWHADHDVYDERTDAFDLHCSSGNVAFSATHRDGAPGTDDAGNLVTELDGEPTASDAVAVGAGRTWVLQGAGPESVLEIDPGSGAIARQTLLGIGGFPTLAVGAGAAWVLAPDERPARLTRIDASGRVRRIAIPGTGESAGYDMTGIAAGLGGLWLLHGDRVRRADPSSGRVVRAIPLTRSRSRRFRLACGRSVGDHSFDSSSGPQSNLLAVGVGAVWVMSNCGPRRARFGWLLRIDPRSNRVTRAIRLRAAYRALVVGNVGAWGLAVGRELFGRVTALHRISLRDGRPTTVIKLPAGEATTDLELGGGAVWLTHVGVPHAGAYTGTLLRLDPARRRLTKVLDLELPANVGVGGGAAWVLDSFARTLTRVAL